MVVCAFINQALKNFQASTTTTIVNRLCGNMKIYANTSSIWLTTVLYTQHLIHITTVCTRNFEHINSTYFSLFFALLTAGCCCCWEVWRGRGIRRRIHFLKLPHNVSPFIAKLRFFFIAKKLKYNRKRNWTPAKVIFRHNNFNVLAIQSYICGACSKTYSFIHDCNIVAKY